MTLTPSMNTRQFSRLFPFGSHLCRRPAPDIAELQRDMETLRREGFNLIKLQMHWAWDEPAPGEFDFRFYHDLIAHAARLDLGVYIGFTDEQAPNWLWDEHPGCRMVGRDGRPLVYQAQHTLPADGKPGPCFDDPGAAAAEVRYLTRAVAELAGHENIVVWNTWQEIVYWAEGNAGQSICYCPNTLARFRQYLQGKYASLDALNRAWHTHYAQWDLVQPDRGAYGKIGLPHDADWRYFMDNVHIAATLQRRRDAIRAADPLHRPVFAHKNCPSIASGADWTYARCQDHLGTSAYPAWFPTHPWDDAHSANQPGGHFDRHQTLLAEMWMSCAFFGDYIRSANPRGNPVWLAEFQGGPISTGMHKGRVPSREDLRRWLLTAISAGMTGICYWVTRAEVMLQEINGFSLLDASGASSDRLQEAGRIGRALQQHADLFAASNLAPAQAAILVDEWNYDVLMSLPNGNDHLAYSTRGWHRLLWDLGMAVDFVELSHTSPADLQRYKAVIAPVPWAIPSAHWNLLARYAAEGGTVIAEACPGRIGDTCTASRGEISPEAAALFGVEQIGLTLIREPGEAGRWGFAERTWGEHLPEATLAGTGQLAGQRLRAQVMLQTLRPTATATAAQACLLHGSAVAGTCNSVGRGAAWLLGTFAGHCGTAYSADASRGTVARILALAGVVPEHAGVLLLRRRIAAGKQAWILTNPTRSAVEEELCIPAGAQAADLLGGPMVVRDGRVRVQVAALDVAVLILTTAGR